jgi:4-hydroxy-3-methylbut-2-enyl diphosphate reductase
MPREFNVPEFYRSDFIQVIKASRALKDPKKKDRSPSILDFGPVRFKIARHFGFCFGVENAIEIAYKVLAENPDKQIYLLSEVIHNPLVNKDLEARGIKFLMKTDGTRLVDFKTLTSDDIVVVPAFGTTVELQKELELMGISPYQYDATCPFVEKVWKRAEQLGNLGFAVIVHGKSTHEETRATFSHSNQTAPTLIVLDMADTKIAISYMKREISLVEFNQYFKNAMSDNFNAEVHLKKIGVVNQTTMLASETKSISEKFKQAMIEIYGEANIASHFADTRDTLCYATYENQTATQALTESGADLALVVGGYNSSNTSHLVELCEELLPTYYIKDNKEILSQEQIRHFNLHSKEILVTKNWIPKTDSKLNIAIAAGASCPDKEVDLVISRVLEFFPDKHNFEQVLGTYLSSN